MSHTSFEALESTLRQLSEIVERNHAQQAETFMLVDQMTKLVDEMKSKSKTSPSSFPPPPIAAIAVAATAVTQ